MLVNVAGASFHVRDGTANLYGHDREAIEKYWSPSAGDVCLDIGTGPGTWSLVALAKGANVIGFEPRPLSSQLLLEAIQLSGFSRFCLFPVGLWKDESRLSFSKEASLKWGERESYIPVTRLDSLLELYPSIGKAKYINIDVEGSELEVIEGAKEVIRTSRARIVVEAHRNVSRAVLMRQLSEITPYSYRNDGDFVVADSL